MIFQILKILRTMLIKWNNEYETGVEWLDVDNRHFISIGNELLNIVDNILPFNLLSLIGEFSKCLSRYFRYEESLMKSINYIYTDSHVNDHIDITIILFSLSYFNNDMDDYYAISSLIIGWLINHLQEHEVKLAKFIKHTVE